MTGPELDGLTVDLDRHDTLPPSDEPDTLVDVDITHDLATDLVAAMQAALTER